MELINFRLFVDFIIPLFEGKTFDQYLNILMVRSLANVILKKVWAMHTLIILRQKLLKEEENSKKQKESRQDMLMAELALSAQDQIHNHMDKSLEPKPDKILAKKVKPNAMKSNSLKNFKGATKKTSELQIQRPVLKMLEDAKAI